MHENRQYLQSTMHGAYIFMPSVSNVTIGYCECNKFPYNTKHGSIAMQ